MNEYILMIMALIAVAGLWGISHIPNKKADHKEHKT